MLSKLQLQVVAVEENVAGRSERAFLPRSRDDLGGCVRVCCSSFKPLFRRSLCSSTSLTLPFFVRAMGSGYLSSPPSSPSLAPIDSSPPSSPGLQAICTPPASPGHNDPFAGSYKSSRRPHIYERNVGHKQEASHTDDVAGSLSEVLTRPSVVPSIPDATPTRSTRVVDPFSASAKAEWRPPTYERKRALLTPSSTSAVASASSHHVNDTPGSPTPAHCPRTADLDDLDDVYLTDDESDFMRSPTKRQTRGEVEYWLWDGALTRAIDDQNGIIDLRYVHPLHRREFTIRR